MHLLVLSAFRPTVKGSPCGRARVSMHLLVLSAFRLEFRERRLRDHQVSMHLLVLSAFRLGRRLAVGVPIANVSMHLLVLSAFRPDPELRYVSSGTPGLNAPFGAQCFPTTECLKRKTPASRLNAPFGAQCFPTRITPRQNRGDAVSMHLLVLSAFRRFHRVVFMCLTYMVSMHLLVLSAFRPGDPVAKPAFSWGLNAPFGAQCFPTADEG